MKKCYLDANFLFYYQDTHSSFHDRVVEIIEKLISEKFHLVLSALVLDEYLYTCLKFLGKPKDQIRKDLEESLVSIFRLPNITLINPPRDYKKYFKIVNLIVDFKFDPRDAYHLFMMLENKVKYLATFDNDFDQIFKKRIIRKLV